MWEGGGQEQGEAEDGFGDNDFDDFAEGGGDDDFGDFDEADDEQETPQPSQSQPTIIPSALPDILADLVSSTLPPKLRLFHLHRSNQ